MADYIGVGERPDELGRKQISLIAVGSALLLLGIVTRLGMWRWLAAAPDQPISPLLAAIFFGLVSGLGEVATQRIRWFLAEIPFQPFLGPDVIFMAPLANILLFCLVGLGLMGFAYRWPKLSAWPFIIFVFSFLSALDILLLFVWLGDVWLGDGVRVFVAIGLAILSTRAATTWPRELNGLIRYTTGWLGLVGQFRTKPALQTDVVRPLPTRRQVLLSTAAVIGSLALGVKGWERAHEVRTAARLLSPPPSSPNVLLLLVDSVRAQSLSLHRHARPTSPQIERIASTGVQFDLAVATAPWALPSRASMFTGRLPGELVVGWRTPLYDIYPTLAELLGASGYRTAGFVGNLIWGGRESGLDRGFQHYEDYPNSIGQIALSSSLSRTLVNSRPIRQAIGYHDIIDRKQAPEINSSVLKWINNAKSEPFFVFVDYFECSEPFLLNQTYEKMSSAIGRDIELSYNTNSIKIDWKSLSHEERHEVVQIAVSAYEESISYVDYHIGWILDQLRGQGALDNTLVIVTSDHGQEFGEHGEYGYGSTLYLTQLQVPLIVSYPSIVPSGTRIDTPVSLRDLPATILELTGSRSLNTFPGSSLSRYWKRAEEGRTPHQEMVFSELERWSDTVGKRMSGRVESLLQGNLHYISQVRVEEREMVREEELYDLKNDPHERQDIAKTADGSVACASFRDWLEQNRRKLGK